MGGGAITLPVGESPPLRVRSALILSALSTGGRGKAYMNVRSSGDEDYSPQGSTDGLNRSKHSMGRDTLLSICLSVHYSAVCLSFLPSADDEDEEYSFHFHGDASHHSTSRSSSESILFCLSRHFYLIFSSQQRQSSLLLRGHVWRQTAAAAAACQAYPPGFSAAARRRGRRGGPCAIRSAHFFLSFPLCCGA